MLAFFVLYALSIVIKLHAAQHLVWEIDYVPLIARGRTFLSGGSFPAYGTLSSVAAYNMPFLVWLHLPVMLFTNYVPAIFIVTMLAFNLASTWFTYRLGARLWDERAGLLAAVLFTFSESGISGAYTPWAQLLLPGFFVMVAYCLFRWRLDGRGVFLAWAIIVTTAAFMTHFTAILLYPVIVVFYLLARPPLKWRGLVIGGAVSLLLLAPYLVFETGRDFADIRAFLSRSPTIAPEVLAQYEYFKPGSEASDLPASGTANAPTTETDEETPAAPSFIDRLLRRALDVPGQVVDGLMVAFRPAAAGTAPVLLALAGLFFGGVVMALWHTFVRARHAVSLRDMAKTRPVLWHAVSTFFAETGAGRALMLLALLLVVIAGLIATRNPSSTQPTYYYGLSTWQYLLTAGAAVGVIDWLTGHSHWRRAFFIALTAAVVALPAVERIQRTEQRRLNETEYSDFNTALYYPIEAAVAWIAADWDGGDTLTISYDIMAESRRFWWVAPWHTVDPLYTIGMAYDFLLSSYYGLENANQSPTGYAEAADYTIVYAPGLARYDLEGYVVKQFGAIYVLREDR